MKEGGTIIVKEKGKWVHAGRVVKGILFLGDLRWGIKAKRDGENGQGFL